MKITPILNNKYLGISKEPINKKIVDKDLRAEKSCLYPAGHRPLLAFEGKYSKICSVDFDKKLANLDGVRCPCCGEPMISRKTADVFIERAYKTPTTREFASLLKEAKPYMKSGYHLLVRYMDKNSEKYPNLPVEKTCNMLSAGAGKIISSGINYQADYLAKLIDEEPLSDVDCQKINECVKLLKSYERVPRWNDVKTVLKSYLSQMDSPKKWEYYSHVRNKILDAYSYSMALKYDETKDAHYPRQVMLMKKILESSISKVDLLYQNVDSNKRFNKLLICPECYINPAKFNMITNSPDSEKKLRHYVRDVANNIAQDKLEGDNAYLYEFMGAVNKHAKGRYRIERDDIKGIAQLKIFKEIKTDFVFENYEGIPCATCGTEMLNHEQKMKLYKELDECENLHEIKNLVNMYSKNVSPKGRLPFKRFNEILNKNPNITDKEMFKKLREMGGKDVAFEMIAKQQEMKEFVKNHKLNSLDKILLVDYLCKLDDIITKSLKAESFDYDEYDKIIADTIGKMLTPDKKELIKIAKENTQTLYIQDNLVRPLSQIIEKTGSRSKVLMQNIFKLAGLTVDHTLAKSLGGADNYANKVAYCKDCNNEKSGMHFSSWVTNHPEMNENFPKQLKKISEIIRDENLDNMHDYPTEAARRAVLLSRGKLHIPTKYNTY